MGRDAWQQEGVKVLGTPMGSVQFSSLQMMEARIVEERRLWDTIPLLPVYVANVGSEREPSSQPHTVHVAAQ